MTGWCVTENLVADCYARHVKDSAAKKPRELKQTTLHECPHVTRLAHALVSDEIEDAKTTTLAILEWTRKVTAHEPHGRNELCGELHLRAQPPEPHRGAQAGQAVLDVGRVQGGQGELHLTGVLRGDIQHDPL